MHRVLSSLLLLGIPATAVAATIPNLTFTTLSERRDMNPYSLGAGINGQVWGADLSFRQIVLFQPDGSIVKIPLTSPTDPTNEMRPITIVGLSNGSALATVYETNSSGSPLKRTFLALVTPDGKVTYTPFPPSAEGSDGACRTLFGGPDCGIVVDDNDVVYVVASQTDKVLTVSPQTGVFRELTVPGAGFIVDISLGPSNDTIAVTDVIGGSVHVVNTATGASTEINLPAPQASPSDIARGPDGRLYITDAANDRLLIVRGANDIDAITLPPEGDRPLSVDFGSDGNAYLTSFGGGHLIQFNPQTKAINSAPIPNGERPAEVVSVACPTASEATVCMVFNSQPPSSFDNNVRRAEITAPIDPVRNYTLEKSFKTPDRIRVGDLVEVTFTITNKSTSSLTATLAVDDTLPVGLGPPIGFGIFGDDNRCDFLGDEQSGYLLRAQPHRQPLTIEGGKNQTFTCKLRITLPRLISNQAVLIIGDTVGAQSNRATIESISERSGVISLPPPDLHKFLQP